MMKAVLCFSFFFLGLQVVSGKCDTGCGKKNVTNFIMPFSLTKNDVLTKTTFEKLVLGRPYLGITELHQTGNIPHHFGFSMSIKTTSNKNFVKSVQFDMERDKPSCRNGSTEMEYIPALAKDKAVFNFWELPREQETINCTEVWFSSCPERYIWKVICRDNGARDPYCPSQLAFVILMVPKTDYYTDADELPWKQIAYDLSKNTELKMGGHSNMQTHNIYVANTCEPHMQGYGGG